MLWRVLWMGFALLAGPMLVLPAQADSFARVQDKAVFVSLVQGRALTRSGVRLVVTTAGRIEGQAFGMAVSGAWQWADGLFCRDLMYGRKSLGANCEMVQRNGDTLRFITDQGRGDFADLRLR